METNRSAHLNAIHDAGRREAISREPAAAQHDLETMIR